MGDAGRNFPNAPNTSGLVTKDDEPKDSLLSEKNQRILVSSLYASWPGPPPLDDTEPGPRRFLAASNVGVFDTPKDPPIVPDVLLATDVSLESISWSADEPRAYMNWEMGKPPELVIELVSNRRGEALGKKLKRYARMHVSAYVVYDPAHLLGEAVLRLNVLQGDRFAPVLVRDPVIVIEPLGLGVGLWEGEFEGTHAQWLRFYDAEKNLLLTGD